MLSILSINLYFHGNKGQLIFYYILMLFPFIHITA